jgi:hypothetical protein
MGFKVAVVGATGNVGREMLNILAGVDLPSEQFGSATHLHWLVEAQKIAFADRAAYVADPDAVDVPTPVRDGGHPIEQAGVQHLTELTPEQKLTFLAEIDSLEDSVDVMRIDTGAGISSNILYFALATQEIVVVTYPEPTATQMLMR